MSRNLFEIDPLALDDAWLAQPKLYHDFALKLADARQEVERAKAKREVVIAEADLAVRMDPQSYGLAGVTEKAIERVLTINKGVLKAKQEVLEAEHKVDVLEAYIRTLEHRKKALENAVILLGMDYWSAPRAKGERAKEATDKIEYDKAFRPGKKRGAK